MLFDLNTWFNGSLTEKYIIVWNSWHSNSVQIVILSCLVYIFSAHSSSHLLSLIFNKIFQFILFFCKLLCPYLVKHRAESLLLLPSLFKSIYESHFFLEAWERTSDLLLLVFAEATDDSSYIHWAFCARVLMVHVQNSLLMLS